MVNSMAKCVYCEGEYSDERLEAGYNYCMDNACHTKGLGELRSEFFKINTIALLHKHAYIVIPRSKLKQLNTRGDLESDTLTSQ